jgi:integrase
MPFYYIPKRDFKVVTMDEVRPYIHGSSMEMGALIAIAFLTGARLSEILMLTKKNIIIDKVANDIRFLMPTLKRRDTYIRELPFNIKEDPFLEDVIIPYVESMPTETSTLFISSKRAYQMHLESLNRKIHVEDTTKYLTFHYFRHSAITYIARELRASSWEVQSFTGHKGSSYEDYMIHGATDRFKGKMRR